METNEQFERRLDRENFLEAKARIGERETHFEGATKLAIQYCSIANAAAIATLIGFVATVGTEIGNPQVLLISFILFIIGIVCAAAGLRLYLILQEKNLQEAVSSYIQAAAHSDISLFNDEHNDSPRYLTGVRRWLSAAFLFFVAGLFAAGSAFPFVGWHTEDSNIPASGSAEELVGSTEDNSLCEREQDVSVPVATEPTPPD